MTLKAEIVPLTEKELERFYKIPIDFPVVGEAMRKGRLTVGVSGITIGKDGRFWAFLDILDGHQSPAIFRRVIRFLKARKADGMSEVYVTREPAFKTSEAFLTRIGFTKTDETLEDKEVWVWRA